MTNHRQRWTKTEVIMWALTIGACALLLIMMFSVGSAIVAGTLNALGGECQ